MKLALFSMLFSVIAAPVWATVDECETAWAYPGTGSGENNAQCFRSTGSGSFTDLFGNNFNNPPLSRWGWYLELSEGQTTSYDVYAAAGQCKLGSGYKVGDVTVSISGGTCTADFQADGGVTITEFHFECGCDITNVEPGQMTVKEDGLADLEFYSDSISGLSCGNGPYYAMVHVVACGEGGVDGDPHFQSWNGKWFDYMGECDLKFLEAPKFDGTQDLNINIRTKLQYDYSYVEAAAVQIGEDVLEVGEYGNYAVNGVDTPYLGGKAGRIGGYTLVHTEVSKTKHTYDIILGPMANITLASYKNLVSVKFKGVNIHNYVADSKGILGSLSGDMLSRKGEIMDVSTNVEAFGQEWQVTDQEPMLFRSARAPQYPAKCKLPQKSASTQRRLGETIAEEAAMRACGHKKGVHFSNCVYDVMAVGDLELAEAGTF